MAGTGRDGRPDWTDNPAATTIRAVDTDVSPARRLRDAIEPLAMVTVWSDAAAREREAAGLDLLAGYVGGRASVLGDVEGAVVAATFGVWAPGFLHDLWARARAARSVAELRDARVRAGSQALREALDGVDTDDVEAVVGTLRSALTGAAVVGRPLFAGQAALPWPDDPHGRLWHAASLLREHRGDSHLGACVAAGLDAIEANVLTELWVGYGLLEYTATRGWSPDAMEGAVARLRERGLLDGGRLSDQGRRVRDGVEEATDRAQRPLVEALGTALDPLVTTLDRWTDAVVARGWFPDDRAKRAAG